MKRLLSIVLCAAFLFLPLAGQTKPYRGAEFRTRDGLAASSFLYGRFEVRLRSAGASGMLSSFFTYYNPASPWNEIDLENMGRYTNEVQFNTIVPTQADNHVQRQVVPFNPHAAFHVYAIEWTPDYVAWRVDGFEIYRQTGPQIAALTQAQQLMMNVWQPTSVDWAGTFNPATLPQYAYYDWVKYYSYTPGTGDNFTLQWTDNFDSFDGTRWQKMTHTFSGNNAQFVQENVVFQNGYMILCLTDNTHSGYDGHTVVDTDVDPPYVISARAYEGVIRVLFSEQLDKASAENTAYYLVPGLTKRGAVLQADGQTVVLSVDNLNLAGSQNLVVSGVKDLAGHAYSSGLIKVIMPLALPVKINVGGSATLGYLADSVWAFARQYGVLGGTVVQQPGTLEIAGTSEDDVFRSAVEGITSYQVRLGNGIYDVTLLMAEPKYSAVGKRVFNVKAQGAPVLTNLDIYQEVGMNAACAKVIPGVQVTDGLLTLNFMPGIDKPVLSGVIVQRVATHIEEGRNDGSAGDGFDIYPNPFNGSANLRYRLGDAGDVNLTVFDVTGKEVTHVRMGYQAAGEHNFRWEHVDLASGIYFCSLATRSQVLTKKVLLLR